MQKLKGNATQKSIKTGFMPFKEGGRGICFYISLLYPPPPALFIFSELGCADSLIKDILIFQKLFVGKRKTHLLFPLRSPLFLPRFLYVFIIILFANINNNFFSWGCLLLIECSHNCFQLRENGRPCVQGKSCFQSNQKFQL